MSCRSRTSAIRLCAAGLLAGLTLAGAASAQVSPEVQNPKEMIQLDFNDVELSVVIDTIARITGRNFIYDDRVRGRVTIVSPTKVTIEQAYAVFESVLQVKGFTTVQGPGGVLKIIPIRDAKESSIETVRGDRPSPNRDVFVTRLIPLRYIDADAINNTLKPLVSKDAAMVSYAPTNTIILTDTAANIRRLLSILEAIDVETYKEELAVLKVEHADAATLAQQISEIYGGEVSRAATPSRRTSARTARGTPTRADTSGEARRGRVRIITDDRTNSLIVLASRGQLEDIRGLVRKLDVPVTGGGSIRVYYLKHADAEELAQTLNSLVSGRPAAPSGGRGQAGQTAQALRAAVTGLAGGVSLTADPATNSLVIQGSKEAYDTLVRVIELLDIERPQVLIEALIMEVDVTDAQDLGLNVLWTLDTSLWKAAVASATDPTTLNALTTSSSPMFAGVGGFTQNLLYEEGATKIQSILRASARDGYSNIISAPHILTSDNEEAEIRIGNNIPIITSRVDAARGAADSLSSSVNVERQDIGVTLRVTPQISEGDTLRLKIFQEITAVNDALTAETGSAEEVGVSLTSRKIENTLVVANGEMVVIGGLISDEILDTVDKVPWLGDIPVLGWLFKSTSQSLRKINLLVFLTPHIIRSREDLELESIRKRKEFRERAGGGLELSEE
ncbi:MAG: type II secretion system secretin GspD [Proteobacteria bacterium]|nr:type II secretion system secretin GspD [Pseudomonadota bacterium]